MFLAARYLNTFPDWDTVVRVLERLEGAEVQTLTQADPKAQIVLLDAMVTQDPEPVPGLFILLSVADGIAIYLASGQHLSSTLDGAKKAFAMTYVEEALQEGEPEEPVVCRVFEFHYQGVTHVLH